MCLKMITLLTLVRQSSHTHTLKKCWRFIISILRLAAAKGGGGGGGGEPLSKPNL